MMKKYIIICTALILLIVAPVESRMTILHLAGQIQSEAPPTCDTTNIIFWWRAEAADFTATNGTLDYSPASPVGTLGGSAAIAAGSKKYGTYGLDMPGVGYSYIYFVSPSATLDEEGRIGFWLYINTWVDSAKLAGVYVDSDNYIRIGLAGTDELSVWWEDDNIVRTTMTTTSANLSTGEWYFIEFAYKYSTYYREVFVNGVSAGSDSNVIDRFTAAVTNIFFGNVHSYVADFWEDNMIISSDSTDDLYTACKDELEWPE